MNSEQSYGDAIPGPVMMTQYDAIPDPVMTHDCAMSAKLQINNDESPKKLFPNLRS